MESWSIVVPVVLVVLGIFARLPLRRTRVIRFEGRIGRGAVVFDRPRDSRRTGKPPALPAVPRPASRCTARPARPKRKMRRH